MKRCGFLIFVLVLSVLVVSVSAQTSLSLWPYYVEVTPESNAVGMYGVVVPLAVMDKAHPDLSDLRLFDSANREIPYAIRVRRDLAREKGLLSMWRVPVPSYQLLRNQGAYASAWIVDLGARVPCDRLKLEIADDSFSRPFQLSSIDDPDNVHLVARGELTRYPGEDAKPLAIVFNEEENVRKLRLQITDYSNPTLHITSIEASAPVRQLVFELKQPASQPLRLFFGNHKAPAPHYDFERELQLRLAKEPGQSHLGEVVANPDYRPEPLPLTERAPWLIYVVLVASTIALGLILFSLARTALVPADKKQ